MTKNKVKWLLLLLAMGMLSTTRAEQGISFTHGLSWQEIKAKAKAEDKYIFIECYPSWCEQSKMMAEKIFPLKEIGDAVNGKFISVSVQVDSTANDNEEIKKWYGDAHELFTRYRIEGYPLFLFFGPDGEIVHRSSGGSKDPSFFLAIVNEALDPNTQYYTLINHYKEHLGDSVFLHYAIIAALKQGDKPNAEQIGEAYMGCLKNPYQKENLELIRQSMLSSEGKAFNLFMQHSTEVDTALGIGTAHGMLIYMLGKELKDRMSKDGKSTPDWKKLYSSVKKQYPSLVDEALVYAKYSYYNRQKMWDECGKALVELFAKYVKRPDNGMLNNNAWFIYENCKDTSVLKEALVWSKTSFEKEAKPDYNNIDTYAHLCYKLGDRQSAIAWEIKSLDIARPTIQQTDLDRYNRVIEKMKNGEVLTE